MDDLTREQKYLLTSMYKIMLNKQPALSTEEANYFGNSDDVKDTFLPNLSSSYVSNLCWKLECKGYIICTPGDNLANNIELTDKTIVYMENRFSNNIKSIIEFLLKLKP